MNAICDKLDVPGTPAMYVLKNGKKTVSSSV